MDWNQVCDDPALKDLPYKIELNEWGQILMSPASIQHVLFQERIASILKSLLDHGRVLQEFPVMTSENVKAPDVVWVSDEILAQVWDQTASPIAPEICVEVMSPGNTKAQQLHKKVLYFDAGAREVWICSEQGDLEFYDPAGKREQSAIAPKFPGRVKFD
ncbi:MAG: Uma2 family endonuclease [Candidatus Competibacteraceae bacterium]